MIEQTTMAMRLKKGNVITMWGWSTDIRLVTDVPTPEANNMISMTTMNLFTGEVITARFYMFSLVSMLTS